MKVMWIKRLIEHEEENWTLVPAKLMNTLSFKDTYSKNSRIKEGYIEFYNEINRYWYKLRSLKKLTASNAVEEIMWENELIRNNDNIYNWNLWKKRGINEIILDENGSLLTHDEIFFKYNVRATSSL